MKDDFNVGWYILCDIVVELTLCHMAYGKASVATDSNHSPVTVTGSTSKKKYLFLLTQVIANPSSRAV